MSTIEERWPDFESPEKKEQIERILLQNMAARSPELEKLLEEMSDHWGYEDPIYRFYHQSFKVYDLQEQTQQIMAALQSLLPDRRLNDWFRQIVLEGTGKVFEEKHNDNWTVVTRPIVEAFFHAHYFLQMICKYAKEIREPPSSLPSGYAAVLYLYRLR